ncbi:hypothetical protein TNCV_2681101 [Trichonephila clavipes]|uniref:Uncharacterized protein n=1 Tax=Trichonephila clavipes TaxID=2585209 RepID=A0A8X6VBC7_TRICX|nr:hypothetical protein TNCV_2681101 [Trichonephila clavipes]
MNYDARPHRAVFIEECIEDCNLERMEDLVQSTDWNTTASIWDSHGEHEAVLSLIPRSLHEMKQKLLRFCPITHWQQGKSMPLMHCS